MSENQYSDEIRRTARHFEAAQRETQRILDEFSQRLNMLEGGWEGQAMRRFYEGEDRAPRFRRLLAEFSQDLDEVASELDRKAAEPGKELPPAAGPPLPPLPGR